MPCSCSGTLETPIPHNGNCCRQSPQIVPLPARLTILHQEWRPRIGSTMFMVSVSSRNKCDAARHHKVNRPYGDANFSTSSHLSHRFSFMTRHQGTSANDRFHTQRSTQREHMAHNTTLRWQSSPNPSGLSILLEESSLAIGSQAFKALMFILGVGNNNRCDRSTIAQSENYMRRRRVPPQRDGPRKHRHNVSNQWLPSMPRSCDGTIVKTTMTCYLSNLLTDGPRVLRSIFTIA